LISLRYGVEPIITIVTSTGGYCGCGCGFMVVYSGVVLCVGIIPSAGGSASPIRG
jgi:hypothetical protein